MFNLFKNKVNIDLGLFIEINYLNTKRNRDWYYNYFYTGVEKEKADKSKLCLTSNYSANILGQIQSMEDKILGIQVKGPLYYLENENYPIDITIKDLKPMLDSILEKERRFYYVNNLPNQFSTVFKHTIFYKDKKIKEVHQSLTDSLNNIINYNLMKLYKKDNVCELLETISFKGKHIALVYDKITKTRITPIILDVEYKITPEVCI